MFLPPTFDLAVAKEAAGLVIQAYAQFTQSKHGPPWTLQGDFDDLGHLSARPPGLLAHVEPFGFVARARATGTVYVVFRGTQSLEDWLSNVSFPQVDHPWGAVEKGFDELYVQCSGDVRTFAQKAGGNRVVVTGHSLGGALSTLATADLVLAGAAASPALYNFASPRVGDRRFAAEMNRRVQACWRVANTEDIVTTVPIATPILEGHAMKPTPLGILLNAAHRLDYEHVGNAVAFTVHNGSIVGNHDMKTYDGALRAV